VCWPTRDWRWLAALWTAEPSDLVQNGGRLGEVTASVIRLMMIKQVPLKRRSISITLHCVASQNTAIFIFAVRTSDITNIGLSCILSYLSCAPGAYVWSDTQYSSISATFILWFKKIKNLNCRYSNRGQHYVMIKRQIYAIKWIVLIFANRLVFFSPEDGGNMFIRNAAIYRQVYTAP
jgi:hypothetical protein